MDQQERMDRMEAGRTATLALGILREPVEAYREKVLNRLIACYRSGMTDHDTILGGIAELTALDNLIKDMQNTVHKGNVAAEVEFKNGQGK